MKNTDIALIAIIAIVSVGVSYFVGNMIFGDPNDRVENLSYIDVIDSNLELPDADTFNASALNPTVEVYVGNCGPLEIWDATNMVCVSKYDDEKKEGGDATDDGGESDGTDREDIDGSGGTDVTPDSEE